DVLKNQGLSDKGGAGLGLVEMARKSGQKLKFAFEKVDDECSYFYLQINLKKDKKVDDLNIPIGLAKDLHQDMNRNKILMMHKGTYSQDSILPILKMIEDNMKSQSEQTIRKKRVFHVLVELLQNISIHAYESSVGKEGIFMIGKSGEQYYISSGNYIINEKVPGFRKQLDKLTGLDRSKLKEMYIEKLSEEREVMHNSAGLGMIDIARESSRDMSFEFFPVDAKISFFTIGVVI
ncbi:MAG: SiaB family protein kinase, partial [Bacteroidetes bacterium]|nr:SiaB family protein kinase [Bacteroidota bacterium]